MAANACTLAIKPFRITAVINAVVSKWWQQRRENRKLPSSSPRLMPSSLATDGNDKDVVQGCKQLKSHFVVIIIVNATVLATNGNKKHTRLAREAKHLVTISSINAVEWATSGNQKENKNKKAKAIRSITRTNTKKQEGETPFPSSLPRSWSLTLGGDPLVDLSTKSVGFVELRW